MKRLLIAVVILTLFIPLGFVGYLSYQRTLNAQSMLIAEPPPIPAEGGLLNLTVTAPVIVASYLRERLNIEKMLYPTAPAARLDPI